jgi:hypothetical protein
MHVVACNSAVVLAVIVIVQAIHSKAYTARMCISNTDCLISDW